MSEKKVIENDWLVRGVRLNFVEDTITSTRDQTIIDYEAFKGGPITVGNESTLLQLFKEIRKVSPVVLWWEGADELFFGYDRAVNSLLNQFHDGEHREKIAERFVNNYLYEIDFKQTLSSFVADLTQKMISELTAVLNNHGPLKGYQFFFLKYHIGALLDRLDRCSMFQSVEARVPFLSKNLIRYALKTNFADPRVYVDGRMMGKAMLREFLLKRTNPEMAFRGK